MAEVEKSRVVIEDGEQFDGKIIPTEQASIQRPVRIHDDATVQGSVYGTSVTAGSGSTIDGSVMAGESLEATESSIRGEVGTPGKVLCEKTRIDGTVTGTRVRLSNCVVRGNVVGTEVILENCVVLGITSADRKLTLEGTLCYTFRSADSVTVDGVMTVLPQAVVDGELTLESPIRVAGLGELETANDMKVPTMTEDDLYEQDGTQYLTLVTRILNLEKVQERLQELEAHVTSIVNDTSSAETDITISDVLEVLDIDSKHFPGDLETLPSIDQ